MIRVGICIPLIVVLLSADAALVPAQTVAAKADEAKLVAVLESQASRKDKVDACRQLAIIGTRNAVASLAALLPDEELSHMARYALEPIPDPAVDQVFREALGTLRGRPLVGVIGSIGVRRDAAAAAALARLLGDPEAGAAAARAFGSIGSLEAADALTGALPSEPTGAAALAFYEGLLRCAQRLDAEGRRHEAAGIYDRLRALPAPRQVRAGALRGALLTRRGPDRLALLREHLNHDDDVLFSAASQTALDLPEPEVTRTLAGELADLPAARQILVIRTLGERGDAVALPALFAASRNGPVPVRLAAIEILPQIGDPAAVPVLMDLRADPDERVSQAALEGLGALAGPEADAAVMAMFNDSNTAVRLAALDLFARRRMTQAVPALLQAAAGAAGRLRPAAIKKVGELGGPSQLPALLDLLMNSDTAADLDAVRQALGDVCAKADDPQASADDLVSRLERASSEQKIVLLRVLGATGGRKALAAVREATGDASADVHVAAIRVLGTWKTPDAAPALLTLARSADTASDRTLCLRGYVGFAARRDLPAEKRLAMCREALDLIDQDEEKKLLLGALGGIELAEALDLITPYLDDPAVSQEAAMTIVTLAGKLLDGPDASSQAPALVGPLEKLARGSDNTELARRAERLLRQAKRAAQ